MNPFTRRHGGVLLLTAMLLSYGTATAERALFVLKGYAEPLLVRRDAGGEVALPVVLQLPNRVRVIQETLMVVDSGSGELILLDLAQALAWEQTGDSLAQRRLPTTQTGGGNPWDVIQWGPDRVAVSNLLGGSLALLGTQGLLEEIPLTGATPQGMLRQSDRLLVCDSGFGTGTRLWSVSLLDHTTDFVQTLENPQELLQTGERLDVLCTGNWSDGSGRLHGLDATSLAPLDTLWLGNHPGSLCGDGQRFAFTGDPWAEPAGVYRWDALDRVVTHGSAAPFAMGGGTNLYYKGSLYSSAPAEIMRIDDTGAEVESWLFDEAVLHFCLAEVRSTPALDITVTGGGLKLQWNDAGWPRYRIEQWEPGFPASWSSLAESPALFWLVPLEPGESRAQFRVRGLEGEPFFREGM